MCGIVAYVGHKDVQPLLIEGLKRLEYRGYDSAGICITSDNGFFIRKAAGRISVLESILEEDKAPKSHIGMAHTRWATHGEPTEINAHPHTDDRKNVAVVHNGIIENYTAVKQFLAEKGHTFVSQTDTEALAVLIGHFYDGNLAKAVQTALREVRGTYGIAVMCAAEPNTLVVARRGSPLIIGVGKDEYVVASDAAAIVEHTTQVVYLNDNEMAVLKPGHFKTMTIDDIPVTKEVEEVEFSLQQIELGGYPHFMLKEIFEQPEAIANCLRGRVDKHEGRVVLGGLSQYSRDIVRARRIIITGCGTAWHAGLVGEFLFEELAKIPTEVEYASEFRYRNPIIEDGTVVIAISQSGETADTLAALREAKDRGALSLGIVNVVGSTIARETDSGIYLHVGPEIGVASTKAFCGQIVVEVLLALSIARRKYMSQNVLDEFLDAIIKIPEQMRRVLDQSNTIREVTSQFVQRENWLFLGRGFNYPVALEGALKLKEISYIHAEGLPAAEMKHGPIALITPGMPVVFIATRGSQYEKLLGNIQEVKARGGKVIAVASEGDEHIHRVADHVFTVPDTIEPLQPLLTVLPLQLLAYHAAVARGCNVDKPRNLAKSVTVE
ncbi:MAG TPA: glutamine--fructose-6-phosphate transaminase (isomerizing) [Phycisphaerae bacterium]|nr:glutamine--fructose-6-phosphate transaminase (isomerizing) [Phycisphaerae bacterium]